MGGNALTNNRPLSVAFFIEGMSASGVDTSTKLLANELTRLGHRVTRFLPWDEGSGSQHPQMVTSDFVRLPAVRVSRDQAVYWTYPVNLPLFDNFRNHRFDLIHVHTNTIINLLAWQIAGAFDLPIVYTYHTMSKDYAHYLGSLPNKMGKWVDSAIEQYDKLVCDRADAVITPSEKAGAYLRSIGVEDVEIIPNGINLRAFSPFASDYLRRRFSIPADDKVLLFAGRLNQEKRPLLAYECFRRVAQSRPDVHLAMVGDGAQRDELIARAERDGLRNRLHLTGLVNYQEMPAIYNSADIWISASCSEVHPMVAIEASACGLPAVTWQDAALHGVIEDGFNGFVVEDQQHFASALHRLLSDPALHQTMRHQAVQKASRFRIDITAQQMLDVYRTVLERNQSKPKPLHIRLEKSIQQWGQRVEDRLREMRGSSDSL